MAPNLPPVARPSSPDCLPTEIPGLPPVPAHIPYQTDAEPPILPEEQRRSWMLNTLGASLWLRATRVPRFHIEPRAPNGTLVVYDRGTNERLIVYSPRFNDQFDAGHHSGRWYVRSSGDGTARAPKPDFPCAEAALAAVFAGWRHCLAKRRSRRSAST